MSILNLENSSRRDCCPLCKATGIYLGAKLAYQEKANFSTHAAKLNYAPELWRCRECLSAFSQYIIDAETAKLLYSTGQSGERWTTATFEQSKTPNVIHTMAALFKDKGSVLDVGCNTGELLDFALSFGCETSGVEYSVASREALAEKGHIAYSSFEESPGGYDVIAAFDLIEHLYDVPAFLKSCREKLAEKGKLAILTGNIDSFSAKLAGARWWYAQYPEHIVFPSRRYFSDYSGMKIEKWVSTYASKGYQNSIDKAIWRILKGMLHGRPYTGLPSLGPDHVLVVFRK